MKRLTFSLAVLTFISACGSSRTFVEQSSGACPEWAYKGQGAFPGDNTKIFAVGVASGIKNPALLRKSADQRARAELSNVMRVAVEEMYDDFAGSRTDFTNAEEIQKTRQALRTLSDTVLHGSTIQDRCKEEDGTMYSLVVLDVEAFKDSARKANDLDARVRTYIDANAADAFNDLDANLQRQRGQQ